MVEACDICATGSNLSGQFYLLGTSSIAPYRYKPQTPHRTGDTLNPLPNRYSANIVSLGFNSDSWSLHNRWSFHCSWCFDCSWFLHSNVSDRVTRHDMEPRHSR